MGAGLAGLSGLAGLGGLMGLWRGEVSRFLCGWRSARAGPREEMWVSLSDGWIPSATLQHPRVWSGGEFPCLPQREPASSEACRLLERNALEHSCYSAAREASLYLARGPGISLCAWPGTSEGGGPRAQPGGPLQFAGATLVCGAPELSLVWTSSS